jgi:predicted RNase H-like nuclease (RuvC/YqgF family)
MLKIFDMLEWIHRNIPNGIRKLVRFCNKCQTAGITEDELISILNSNCLKTAIKEVDSSNNTNEVTKEPKEYKETTTKKKILSKDPLTNNRMLVRKLRHQVVNLENQIKQLENLVGLQTIKLCKLDKRMTSAIKSLVSVVEEELDKQSEQNAKASFLLCQVIEIFPLIYKFELNLFLFLLISS